MITKHRNGSLLMKFDSGDIGMTIGGEYGRAAIFFDSQAPQRSPSAPGFGPVGYAKTNDFPLSMVFESQSSIDSLIQHLWAAKKIMEGQIVLCPVESERRRPGRASGQ